MNGAGRRTAILPRSFYERSAEVVAAELIGTTFVHGRSIGSIVETEAYLGEFDPAAHARHGRTERTRVLYDRPGLAYVYQTRHHLCLNVSTGARGTPGCVLIRALRPLRGLAGMRLRRGLQAVNRLANGPANLCSAFDIRLEHYGNDLTRAPSPYIRQHDPDVPRDTIVYRDERIGISRAERWLLRFVAEDAPVSRRPGKRAQPYL